MKPFRAIRYAPDRVGDISDVTSPPYDVIGSGVLASLLAASPYNSVRLTLPGPETGGPPSAAQAGALAARRLDSWRARGVLAQDPRPALYLYEQQNGPAVIQRGLLCLVRVGPPAESGILPHEAVMPGPVAGRRALMAATRANLEPIFLVYNGGGKALPPGTPLVETVTADGVTHRLRAITDPDAQAAVAADLAGRTALIADGHHRFAAYRELRDSQRADGHGAGPWDYGLAFLVDGDAYPLRLGAIHRVVPRLPVADAARLAASAFTVTELPDDFDAALSSLAEAGADGGHAFVLAGPGRVSGSDRVPRADRYWLAARPDAARVKAAMPASASARWRSLDSAVLAELLLAQLWGIKDNEQDVLVSHDAADAVRGARAADGTAVLCNPVPFAAVKDIAADGECVPRKSTSFGPKPRTGLVFRTFDDLDTSSVPSTAEVGQ